MIAYWSVLRSFPPNDRLLVGSQEPSTPNDRLLVGSQEPSNRINLPTFQPQLLPHAHPKGRHAWCVDLVMHILREGTP